jgi:hypothetical protein
LKNIRFSKHALNQIQFRGTTLEEVITAISESPWDFANEGKLECRLDFIYNKEWNGKYYEVKQVRPIFVEEEEIVVITVYVYYIKARK